jgi:cell division protein ZipA
MAAELRWILLTLSLVLLAGIWWWGRRRSSQAPGDAQLREVTPSLEPQRHEPLVHEPLDSGGWGIPPLEPLSIRTQDFEGVPVLDIPMMVQVDPTIQLAPIHSGVVSAIEPLRSQAPAAEASSAPTLAPAPAPAHAPALALAPGQVPTLQPVPIERSGSTPAQAPNAAEQQKIITVRVCTTGDARWPGATLLSALELHGLAYGRYQVFHRRHVDGRSLFCVASLIEPGTFDVARMSSEEFRGITLFAVLPGPVEPLLTVDELLSAARGLAQELAGMVQDSKGMPLSPQRAAALRDDVARFQASLASG